MAKKPPTTVARGHEPGNHVTLTDDELVVLDGKCSPAVQTLVERAKGRITLRDARPDLPPALAGLIANVVLAAHEEGKLVFRHDRLRHCSLCGTSAGYVKFKSGQRAGQNNTNKPKYLQGYEFVHRFITMQGSVNLGGCRQCIDPVLPLIKDALRGVPVELPERLRAEGEPKRIRHEHRRCTACGWEGHEGEMKQLPAVMGGRYPGGCPSCDAEQNAFGARVFENLKTFTVVEVPEPASS